MVAALPKLAFVAAAVPAKPAMMPALLQAYLVLEPVPKNAHGPMMLLVFGRTVADMAKVPLPAKVSVAPVPRLKLAAVLLMVKVLAELLVQFCAPLREMRTLLPAVPSPSVTAPAFVEVVMPPVPRLSVRAVPPPVSVVVPVLLKVSDFAY